MFSPQEPSEKAKRGDTHLGSSAGEAEIEGSLGLTDDQSCLLDESLVSEILYLKKPKMDGS